jgi:uncharacterized protein YozE (UPF0346 family)
MTTFRAWLTIARVTNDPEGDFVADARRDPTFPEAVPDIKAMRGYLLRQGACREALATVPRVWRRYERWLERSVAAAAGAES